MSAPFELRFAREADWKTVVEQIRADRGILFGHRGDRALTPLATVEIAFLKPEGEICRVEGRVVRLTDREVAFTFDDAAIEAIERARFVDKEPPLWQRYDGLPKSDKIHLARYGNADARRHVLKDRDQALHVHVLSNPGLTTRELASLVRANAVNALFFNALAKRDDLLRSAPVVEALVRNPRTPIKLAVDLVARLNPDVAARIAKQGRLRRPIVQAARRRVLRR